MFFGSIPALVTPFAAGRVDLAIFRDFVEWQIDAGSNALVPCGTTGEAATLSTEEHKELIALTVEVARGRVPVIAGCGSNNTAHAIELTKNARDAGADAALHVPPYYNRPNQDGIYAHLAAVADLGIPIVLYNVPARTITDISVETMGRLSRLPNVIAVKDATGNLARVSAQRQACGVEFVQLSGNDDMALGFNAMGGVGCISVTANVAPKLMHQMCAAALVGDVKKARDLNLRLLPLHQRLFVEANPIPVKWALAEMGMMEPGLRLPLSPLSEKFHQTVREALHEAGITLPGLRVVEGRG